MHHLRWRVLEGLPAESLATTCCKISQRCPLSKQAIKNEELKALPEYAGQGEERHSSPEASEAELGDEMEAALHQGALNSIAKAR